MKLLLWWMACQQIPTLDAEMGFQGSVFPGAWNRLSSTLSYEGIPREVELRITVEGAPWEPVIHRRLLTLGSKVRMRLQHDFYLTGQERGIQVEILSKGVPLQNVHLGLPFLRAGQRRLLAVGTLPELLTLPPSKSAGTVVVRCTGEGFPASALPLRALDVILFPGPVELSPEQEAALRTWVEQGGRLVFGPGRSTLLRQSAFWRDLCPLEEPVLGVAPVSAKGAEVSLARVTGRLKRGRVTMSFNADPALIEGELGRGDVVFMTFLPEATETGRVLSGPELLAALLGLPPPPPPEDPTLRRRPQPGMPWPAMPQAPRHSVHDLDGMIKRLLPAESFWSRAPLGLGTVIGVSYLLLIGPVEFLRLRKAGRLRRGWISFSLLVLGFAGLTLFWGGQFSRSNSRLVHAMLWDDDRILTYSALRAGDSGIFEADTPGLLRALPPLTAFGGPGTSEGIQVELPSRIQLPLPALATRFLIGERRVEARDGSLTATWTGAGQRSLAVKNSSPLTLKEVWLLSKDRVRKLPEIPAGAALDLTPVEESTFEAWARKVELPEAERPAWGDWDALWSRVAPPRFGLFMSCFEIAHRGVSRERGRDVLLERGVDFSGWLDKGRALLVGSFDQDVSRIRTQPAITAETYGWMRVRVREAD